MSYDDIRSRFVKNKGSRSAGRHRSNYRGHNQANFVQQISHEFDDYTAAKQTALELQSDPPQPVGYESFISESNWNVADESHFLGSEFMHGVRDVKRNRQKIPRTANGARSN